jgi:uncharacterized membrane protein YfcA
MLDLLVLPLLLLMMAALYSSVGHAGASGYLAVMALMGIAPTVMKPTSLVLNILVASIATIRFYQAGAFSWGIFWPFAAASVPLAFLGGAITLPGYIYKPVVGVVLLFAAYRLFRLSGAMQEAPAEQTLPLAPAVASGAGIGLLSGLTGVGGGIFLTPLLLFKRWAQTRKAAGVSAAFILVNSIAGLAGAASSLQHVPGTIPVWAGAVLVGGLVGTEFGTRRLDNIMLRRLLAVVLVIAGLKMMLT